MPSIAWIESPIALKYCSFVSSWPRLMTSVSPSGQPPAASSAACAASGSKWHHSQVPASPPGTPPGTTHESAGTACPGNRASMMPWRSIASEIALRNSMSCQGPSRYSGKPR